METENTVISQFNQIGIAVHNLEETAQFLKNNLGIEVLIIPMPQAHAVLRGREVSFTTKIGLARVGSMDLELMEIVEGEHIVKEFIDKHGPGIHHLGMYVDDLDAAVEKWTAAGGKVIQRTKHPSGIGTAFLDTESTLGNIYIELIKF
jgi:methylmalonyl-CoA/ethylmalonyl-CoA epimerase